MKHLHCVIIGDANIDIITTLEQTDLKENPCFHSRITTSVGGNGIFFCEAAKEAGFSSVHLLCSLGCDLAAEEILAYCQRKKLSLINYPSRKQTGKAIILYKPDDKRILIADRGANEDFLIGEKELPSGMINSANILHISGYHLLSMAQSEAVATLAKAFIKNGAFVVFDTVPHDIYERIDWDEYLKRCVYANAIIAEATTIAGFMGADPGHVSPDDLADFLLGSFHLCIVRLNALSDFLIADRNHRTTLRVYYRPQLSSLRFSDRVAAFVLQKYLDDPQGLFASPTWADEMNRAIGEKE